MWRNREEDSKTLNMTYSIGLKVSEEGNISDVLYGGPAQKAGVSPATKLVAVNGRQYYPIVLREAVQSAVSKTAPIELLVKNGEYFQTFKIDYHGGELYPHLTRDDTKPDVLSKIIEPLAKKRVVGMLWPTTLGSGQHRMGRLALACCVSHAVASSSVLRLSLR